MSKFLLILITSSVIFGNYNYDRFLSEVIIDDNCSFMDCFDCIYLINLDERKDRLKKSKAALGKFHINPQRVKAINGWSLSAQAINQIALNYSAETMVGSQWAMSFQEPNLTKQFEFLHSSIDGCPVFSCHMTPGAIGCLLSHISILKHAYASGYKRIWILEDDFVIQANPLVLADYVHKLDKITGADGWDLIYTDCPKEIKSLQAHSIFWFLFRPDCPLEQYERFGVVNDISEDFKQIGQRTRTHSMILSQSGIQKIYHHFLERGVYNPIDHELPHVHGIKMFAINKPIVTFSTSSDSNTKKPTNH
ncbi:MAG: glycosyltransferase family 25 protein [Chlamydiales bacterium]|nr:glycosyltransferase family 25 protein [Chlamydiales bacterium]